MILHTNDGGKRWKNQLKSSRQSSEKTPMPLDGTCPGVESPAKSLMKVFFLDQNKGFTVGADGTILRTENGGSSWEHAVFDSMAILPEELIMNGIITLNLYDVFFLNENSGWIGPFTPGEEISASHSWSKKGTYDIKVKAKDTDDVESPWSDPMEVSLPKQKKSHFPLLNWLFSKVTWNFPFLNILLNGDYYE